MIAEEEGTLKHFDQIQKMPAAVSLHQLEAVVNATVSMVSYCIQAYWKLALFLNCVVVLIQPRLTKLVLQRQH